MKDRTGHGCLGFTTDWFSHVKEPVLGTVDTIKMNEEQSLPLESSQSNEDK